MDLIITIITALSGGLFTGVPIFFLTKKRYNTDIQGSELDQVEKAAKIWRVLSEELELRFRKDITELREENTQLRLKMSAYEKQLSDERDQNSRLLQELKKFNKTAPVTS